MSAYGPQKLLARYVRDLLQQPEGSVVVLGRDNINRNNLQGLQIAVDTLGPDRRLNASRQFDGDAETMSHAQQRVHSCTIDFYGDQAPEQANKFMLISNGQTGYELQRDGGIAVFLAGSVTDVKLLTGEKFTNRLQVQVNLQYTASAVETVLRIDEAQLTVIED